MLPQYENTNPYTRAKKDAEDLIKSSDDVKWAIVNPTECWGRGAGGSKKKLIKSIDSGILKHLNVSGSTNIVDVEDCARGIANIARNFDYYSNSQILLLGEDVSYKELCNLIRRHLGLKETEITPPDFLARSLYKLFKYFEKKEFLTSLTDEY